jgi:nucleotide-binding universal stress UspA family protein
LMGKILCATRGGEASIRTQKAAIQRAKESGDELIFVFVVDVEFLARADYALRPDVVVGEMEKMGDFLMVMAVERAQQESVPARYLIRHGMLHDELIQIIEEEGITVLVLGRPAAEHDTPDRLAWLESFAADIAEETGIEVWIPPGDAEG